MSGPRIMHLGRRSDGLFVAGEVESTGSGREWLTDASFLLVRLLIMYMYVECLIRADTGALVISVHHLHYLIQHYTHVLTHGVSHFSVVNQ